MTSPASSFKDLVVWQEAHQIVLMIYRLTEDFPKNEQYGIISQMRRAAVSVPANIAEGFKRVSYTEKARFYDIAEASLEELKYFLILSCDLAYCAEDVAIAEQTEKVGRLLHRFSQGARSPNRSSKSNF